MKWRNSTSTKVWGIDPNYSGAFKITKRLRYIGRHPEAAMIYRDVPAIDGLQPISGDSHDKDRGIVSSTWQQ